MRKTIKNKLLISILAINAVNLFASADAFAVDVTVDNNFVTSHNDDPIATNADFNGYTYSNAYSNNEITISGTTLNNFNGINAGDPLPSAELTNNTITLTNSNIKGKVIGVSERCRSPLAKNISIRVVDTNIDGGITGADLSSYGESISAENIKISLEGNSIITGDIILVTRSIHIYLMETKYNEIILKDNVNVENSNIYAFTSIEDYTNNITSDNTILTLDGWNGSTKSVKNFTDINFDNINWQNNGTVLTITEGADNDLANTEININSIAGGSSIKAGDKMTLIASNTNLSDEVKYNINDTFTAGVAREGLGSTSVENGNVSFKVNSIKLSSQAVSAAQTRAASAAFVNQSTDLISDSLDTISRDDNYGVKTFAAVHGNRSKYDVADDIKINGWSTIVGVGNADKFDNGSELSWGVFYENGSGNYRTYNSFNNEFFRGDGSMIYNGGGIAARYENKNGVYTEGSLRAGMLKNELDNAMRDVNGSYGYETESAYYGAHIGVGKIISLSESSDLDIYGKFFHTYTEGDSITIADDKFDFDSITSDRLRVGARITSNKENKFSTYYGLAYEYEFNGDADMTAQGLRAYTQSLQGSSVMAEVGFNYQPTPGSPWSFDLNMRGYTGERQGGSFNVQATYTF